MTGKIFANPADAVNDIPDGASVMFGGFARGQGIPYNLIDALVEKRVKELTIIGMNHFILNDLVRENQVAKVITTFEARARYDTRYCAVEEAHRRGEIELEAVPLGTLAMRIEAWAAGVAGFYTRVGADTLIAEGKEERMFDGEKYILERALGADFALIKAHRSDRIGNLVYYKAARNINPVMALGARTVIVEVDKVVEPGELDPEVIITPGILVDRIVEIKKKTILLGEPLPERTML